MTGMCLLQGGRIYDSDNGKTCHQVCMCLNRQSALAKGSVPWHSIVRPLLSIGARIERHLRKVHAVGVCVC